jgi:transcriptional regulator with XRE-family HTH domain
MMSETNTKKIHEGRNVKRFREMLSIKQDALAADLGDDWNQQKISLLEQKETIDPNLLQQISAALKIPAEAIQNFDEEAAINIIANTISVAL